MSNSQDLHALSPEQNFTTAQELVDDLGSFLQQSNIEGSKSAPYVDSAGIPSVGIGINLRVYETLYFDVLGISASTNQGRAERSALIKDFNAPYANNDTAALTARLTTTMASYGGINNLNLDSLQITRLFDDVLLGETVTDPNNPQAGSILAQYETFLKNHNIQTGTTVTGSNFSGSLEGLAILSLFYNNQTKLLPPNGKLVPDLNQNNFNRPDAWFQIRYGSNSGYKALIASPSVRAHSGLNGTADRRYLESTFFGLYGDGMTTPSLQYAHQVYAELSKKTNGTNTSTPTVGELTNREFAFKYESLYSSEIDVGNDTVLSGVNAVKPFETGASVAQLTSLTVSTLVDELEPAASVLEQHFLTDTTLNRFANGYEAQSIDPLRVNPLDVQIAADQGGSDLVASKRNGYQLGTGNYQDSMLVAQGGSDTLDGSGLGNDALIGGSGEDTFIIGDGDDYIVAGTGSALIGGPLSALGVGTMGAGNDTIVLGDAQHAASKGTDTVWAGAGDETFYLAAGNSDVVHLNNFGGQAHFKLVDTNGAITSLDINATGLVGAGGAYLDQSAHSLVLATQNSDGTESVKIIGLASALPAPHALRPQIQAEQASLSSPFTGVLELDGFQGNSDAGITLNAANTTTPGSNNLSNFTATAYSDHTEYQDLSSSGGGDSMVGASTTPGDFNILEGEGNAGYIYAGDGNNYVFANDVRSSPVGEVFSNPVDVMIQGGSGNQLLVGLGDDGSSGNANETILGGNMGQDTTAFDTIDGGGAFVNALLVGGSQNSLIFGGIGSDTIIAGSALAGSTQPDPATVAMAGLSFWASSAQSAGGGGSVTVTGEPEVSFPTWTDPADFQINIALNQLDGSYGTAFGLLGSSSNSGLDDNGGWHIPSDPTWTLPGSLLIGGSGEDYLIGNGGNDTIIGGTPAHPTIGVVDEVLVGGGGANLIYGGSGTELIFADLSAAGNVGWADLNPLDADTIYGGSGDDYIYGSGGNDFIYGGSGNYSIYAGNGNTYIETGTGNSFVYGGDGDDTIVDNGSFDNIDIGDGNSYVQLVSGQSTINGGAGDDTINADGGDAVITGGSGHLTLIAGASTGSDTIQAAPGGVTVQLTADLTETTLIVRYVSGNLVLSDATSDTQISIDDYFSGDTSTTLQFADGATWGSAELLQASMMPSTYGGSDTLVGSDGSDSITAGYGDTLIVGISGENTLTGGAGNDSINGGSGADTIEGGSGTTYIQGGTGSERYVFNVGDGSETIEVDTTSGGMDTLQLGAGILPSDVSFARLGSSNDLVIQFGTLTDSRIDVQNFMDLSTSSGHQLGSIIFSDGSNLTGAQVQTIAANTYVSDNGSDAIAGGPGNNTIYGGSGSDTLIGGSGTSLIIGGSGTELIEGGSGYNTLIGGSGNDTIIAGPNGDHIETGTGRALVETGDGNDTVDTTGGVDTLQPSDGNDTYQFGIGSGQDTLKDYAYYDKTGADQLSIDAGLTASDLTLTRVGDPGGSDDDLVVGVKGTKDSFTIQGYFSYRNLANNAAPLSLVFQDGSSLNFSQLEAQADMQSDWNGAVNSLDPAPDSEEPSNIFETMEFARGDGQMVLDSYSNISADDVANGLESNFYLAAGIRPQDVAMTAEGDSVLLSIKGTSDSLYIPGLLDASIDGYALTAINFYDGTVWDLPALLQHVNYGTGALSAAGQVINATSDSDTLIPAGPNDTINAINGDTVGFGHGDGQVVLNMDPGESGGSSGLSTVALGAGILPEDVTVELSDFGIVLTLKDTGERLAVDGEPWDGWDHAIDQIKFANGSTWDTDNIQAMMDTGSPVELADAAEAPDLATVIQALPTGTSVLFGGVNGGALDLDTNDALVVIDDGYGNQNASANVTVNYDAGDGNVTIYGGIGSDLPNAIQFGVGLNASDISLSGTFEYNQTYDTYSDYFSSDGEGEGTLLVNVNSTGKTISIPYSVYLDDSGQLAVESAISNLIFNDGEVLDPAVLIANGGANISAAPGLVAGTRGSETLMGAAGDTIDAAIGNTVVLGSNQTIASDGSALADSSSLPSQRTTYLFNSETNGDTLSTNVSSTLKFAPGIDESDVNIIQDHNGNAVVYLKDSGSYVVINTEADLNWPYSGSNYSALRAGASTVLEFADGNTFTPPNGYYFTGSEHDLFTPTTTSILSDENGDVGYYAFDNSGGQQKLLVRGSVSSAFLGGSASYALDAAASDVSELSSLMQSAIDPTSLTQPVTISFEPSVGDATVVNYDANDLVIDLPSGVTSQNLSVSEDGGNVTLSVDGAGDMAGTLTIEGFYSQVEGALQEKPLEIDFANGTSWNDQDIQNAIWQRGGGSSDTSQDIWIVSPSAQPIDLTSTTPGEYNQSVEIKNDGSNVLKLGQDFVDASQGSDTFIIGRSTNSQITNFDPTVDTIQFAAGIDPNDIEVSQAYTDTAHTTFSYRYSLRSTGAALLTVSGSGLSPSDSVDAFVQFDNGVSWTSSHMAGTQAVGSSDYYTGYNGYGSNNGLVISQAIRGTIGDESLVGGLGDDVISAGVGNDTLSGGGGHDTLYGAVGNDTFVFGHGSGHETIVAGGHASDVNTLAFTPDVAATDVSVVRPNAGSGLELILNDTGESVLLPNFLDNGAIQAVQLVTFDDGTSWNAGDLRSLSKQGSSFSSYLQAGDGVESISGGSGNDTIVGDDNADTLIAGSGNDLILAGNGTSTILGGAGADTIMGGPGSDLIVAGSGDTSILGGLGDETYQFGASFGHDTLIADASSDGTSSNALQFEAGIDSSAVSFSLTSDGGLLISLDSNSDSIYLPNHYVNGAMVGDVDHIKFGDGTTVLMSQVDDLLSASGGAPVHYVGDGSAPMSQQVKSGQTSDVTPLNAPMSLSRQSALAIGANGMPSAYSQHRFDSSTGLQGSLAGSAQTDTSLMNAGTDAKQPKASASADPTSRSPRLNLSTQGKMPMLAASPEASPGAPEDLIANDANDPSQSNLGAGDALGAAEGRRATTGLEMSGGAKFYSSRGQGAMLGRTINATNGMVKALLASGSVHHLAGAGSSAVPLGQIQMQDGTVWSLSALDQAMAALTPGTPTLAGSTALRASFGSADLAHAQLISALATFSPSAAADTSLPPTASEAYAVAVAVQAH